MFKNNENEDDEEKVDKKLTDNIKYDDEYYRNYIKQYSEDSR